MWLLNELTKENIAQMKELGFRLPIDSLYSLDKPSVANSVVIFGRGCTGVTVSDKGSSSPTITVGLTPSSHRVRSIMTTSVMASSLRASRRSSPSQG